MAGRNIVNTITREVFFKDTHYAAGNGLIPSPNPGYFYLVTAEMKELAGNRPDLIVFHEFEGYKFRYSTMNNRFGFKKGDTVVFRTGIHDNRGYISEITTETEYPIVCLFQCGKDEIAIRFNEKGECNHADGVQLMRLYRVGDKVCYFVSHKPYFGEVIAVSTDDKKLSIYMHATGTVDRTFFEDGTKSSAPDDMFCMLHLTSPAVK